MSVFTSKLNPVSGKMEWILMDDAFDYSQQIARSAYADMLHDEDRVGAYYFLLFFFFLYISVFFCYIFI